MAKKASKTAKSGVANIAEPLRALTLPIDSVKPDPKNARKHGKKDLEALKQSLREFGQDRAILVRKESMHIVAGNGTWTAAKALGWTEIAAAVVPMSDKAAMKRALADNRIAELSEWDEAVLFGQIAEIKSDDSSFADLLALEDLLPKPDDKAVEIPEVLGAAIMCQDETHQKLVYQTMSGYNPESYKKLFDNYPKPTLKLVTL